MIFSGTGIKEELANIKIQFQRGNAEQCAEELAGIPEGSKEKEQRKASHEAER